MVGKMVVGVIKMLAGLQQRLGWDAAHVGARSPGRRPALFVLPLINTGYVKAQLGRADGGDIATRAAANDDHVKLFAHNFLNQLRTEQECAAFLGLSRKVASFSLLQT